MTKEGDSRGLSLRQRRETYNGREDIVKGEEDSGGCLEVEGQVPSQRRRCPVGATGSDGTYSFSPLS